MSVSMEYEHYLMDAKADAAGRVEFTPDAEIECEKTSGAYTLEMVTDKEVRSIDWHKVTVSGKDGGTVRMQMLPDGSGLILKADSLQNVSIKANSRKAEASRSFSTEYGAVKIYEIDEKTIGLAVDTNGDSDYETVLEPEAVPERLRGDANGDSDVSIEDAQYVLNAYTKSLGTGFVDMPEEAAKASDVNGDGEVSVDDAQYILIYYTKNQVAGKKTAWEDIIVKPKT